MFRRLRRASAQIDPLELDESDYERSGDVNQLRSPGTNPRLSFENGVVRQLLPQSPLAQTDNDSAGGSSSFDSDERGSVESLDWEEHDAELLGLPGQTTPLPSLRASAPAVPSSPSAERAPSAAPATTATTGSLASSSMRGALALLPIPDPEPVSEIPSDLKCCICLTLLNDPRTIPCEAHHMACKRCLLSWLEERLTCPLCKDPIEPEMICLVPPMVSRILGGVKVFCGHRGGADGGCAWQGEFSEYAAHIERHCKHVRVRCPNTTAGCRAVIQRKDIDAHIGTCEYRRVQCVFCGASKNLRELEKHTASECPKTPIDCPNKCEAGTGILREKLSEHMGVCMEHQVECAFGGAGCDAVMKRKDVQHHMEESMALHLVLAMKKINDDERRIDELEKGMAEKDKIIADLTQQLRQMQPRHKVQWKVNKSLQMESFSFKSPLFEFAGCSWCLSVKRKARSRDYLSVYLHKCSHSNTALSVHFSVRAVNWKDEALSIGEETTEVFKGVTAWGWSNMIEVWLLGDRRHGFLGPDGSLVIEADLRLAGGLVTTQFTTPAPNAASASATASPRERR